MSTVPSRIFRRTQPEAQGLRAHQRIRMRLRVQAMSTDQTAGRNLTVDGVNQSYPAHSAGSSYTAHSSVVRQGGQQWLCIKSHGPKTFDPTDWWELRPLSWYRVSWANQNKRGGNTVAQMFDAIKAANPGHLFCQYIYTAMTTFDTNYGDGLQLGPWAVDGASLLVLKDNSDVPKRITRTATLTSGSAVIPLADTSGIEVGMYVTVQPSYAGGIDDDTSAGQTGTTVSDIDPGVSMTLSKNAIGSGSRTVVFHNFPTAWVTYLPYMHPWNYRKAAEGAVGADGLTIQQKMVQELKEWAPYQSRRFDGWAFDDQYAGKTYSITATASDPIDGEGEYVNQTWGALQMYGQGYYRPGQNEWNGDPDVLPSMREFYRRMYDEFARVMPTKLIFTNANMGVDEFAPGRVDIRLHEGMGKDYSFEQQSTNAWLQVMQQCYREQKTSRQGLWGSCIGGHTFYDPGQTISVQSDSRVGGQHQDMLYWLCTALLSDALFGYVQDGAGGVPAWPVEARGRAYLKEFDAELGSPTEPMPVAAWSDGVWMRRYSNGLVLVNPRLALTGDWSAGNSKTITLPTDRAYRRLTGTRNPADDGAIVTSITLAARRGLILLCA